MAHSRTAGTCTPGTDGWTRGADDGDERLLVVRVVGRVVGGGGERRAQVNFNRP